VRHRLRIWWLAFRLRCFLVVVRALVWVYRRFGRPRASDLWYAHQSIQDGRKALRDLTTTPAREIYFPTRE
jgi:hypothetical protein